MKMFFTYSGKFNFGRTKSHPPYDFLKITIEGAVVLPVKIFLGLFLFRVKMKCTFSLPHLDFFSYVCYTLYRLKTG